MRAGRSGSSPVRSAAREQPAMSGMAACVAGLETALMEGPAESTPHHAESAEADPTG